MAASIAVGVTALKNMLAELLPSQTATLRSAVPLCWSFNADVEGDAGAQITVTESKISNIVVAP